MKISITKPAGLQKFLCRPRRLDLSTFVLQKFHQLYSGSMKERKNIVAPGVLMRVSHPRTILSQCCLTLKCPVFSLLHGTTLQPPDNMSSGQKNMLFLQVSGKWVVVSGRNFCKNLFPPGAHFPSEFCRNRSGSVACYRGLTNTQTNKHADIPLYIN